MAMTAPAAATTAVMREEIAADGPVAPQFPPRLDDTPQSDFPDPAVADSNADIDSFSNFSATQAVSETETNAEMQEDTAAGDAPISAGADAGAESAVVPGDMLAVIDAPPVVPYGDEAPRHTDDDAASAHEPIDEGDIESFAARRLQRQRIRRRNPFYSPGLSSLILILIAIVGGLLIWRKDIVRLAPQTASFYDAVGLDTNLRGLTFTDIKTVRETQDGIPVLVVEGKIVSTAPRPVEVPRIRLAVRASSGQELYSWTAQPPRPILQPAESITFVSRLASPPSEAREVMIRFFNRRDAASGSR